MLVTTVSSILSTGTLYNKKRERWISKTKITNMYYYVPGTALLESTLHSLTHLILRIYIRYTLLIPLFYRIKAKAHITMSPKLFKDPFKWWASTLLTCSHLEN